MEKDTKPQNPSIAQVARSVLAGAIGVQSEANRERDFNSSSIWPFVVGGIVFTVLFVIALMVLVSAVT